MAQRRFRDPRLVGMTAAGCLTAGAMLDLYGGFRVAVTYGPPADGGGGMSLLVGLATIVAFLIWMDRTYANVEATGGSTEHSLHWATLGFFIPPLFLFRPYQIVHEAWLHSHDRSDRRRVPWVLAVWWVAFLVSRGLGLAALVDKIGHLHLIRSATSFLAAIAAVHVVLVLVRDQQALQHRRTRMEMERQAVLLRERRRAALGSAATDVNAPASVDAVARTAEPLLEADRNGGTDRVPPVAAVPGRQATSVPVQPVPAIRFPSPARATAAPRRAEPAHWSSLAAPRLWHRAALVAIIVSAISMTAGAAVLGARSDTRSLIAAGVYAIYGIVLLLLCLCLRSPRFESVSARDAAPRALALAGFAVINTAVLAGVLLS